MTTQYLIAQAANINFGVLPSGATYTSNAAALVSVTNGSTADTAALIALGCVPLAQLNVGTTQQTLAILYSTDTSTPFAQGTWAFVYADATTGNNGFWLKTGSGTGSGNWTQQTAVTVSTLQTQITANTTAISTETTRAMAAEALLAPLASPALTGNPTVPTQSPGNNTTRAASTAFVTAAVAVETSRATTAEGLLAPLASPALTGAPTAPTATALTNNTQVGTTAYTDAAVAVEKSRAQSAEALLAPLASPALTGNPTVPTQSPLTNSTRAASTAYTDAAVAVETSRATTAEALKAPLASPALTGTPTVPTAAPLTSDTQAASTAYTDSAVGVETSRATAAEALKAPLASPALTGTPTVPTAAPLTSDTQAASTAYADAAVGAEATARASAVSAEASARAAAINSEAATRANVDGTLSNSISAETTRAQTAEATNANAIANETIRAESVEAGLNNNIIALQQSVNTLTQQMSLLRFQGNFCTGGSPPGTVQAATTTGLPTFFYNPYASGDQIVFQSNTPLSTVDGVAMSVGVRLLVKNQTGAGNQGALANGIYTMTQQGDGSSVPVVLTRAGDASNASLLGGIECIVTGGTTQQGTAWILPLQAALITVGVTQLNFVQLAGTYSAQTFASRTMTSSGNVLSSDIGNLIKFNATSGAIVATFNAATVGTGLVRFERIDNTPANLVTIQDQSSNVLIELGVQGSGCVIESDGTSLYLQSKW